jgi:hypothetical protein
MRSNSLGRVVLVNGTENSTPSLGRELLGGSGKRAATGMDLRSREAVRAEPRRSKGRGGRAGKGDDLRGVN